MKTILITGCSSGFGLEMTQTLLRAGHRVIATLRNADQRKSIFEELQEQFRSNLIVKSLDVTSAEQRAEVESFIKDELNGQLDILVNNAGVGYFGALEDMSEEQLRDQMELNFFAPSLLTKAFLPFLRRTKGSVINISSIMGQYSMPLGSVYSASKYALEGLTEGLYYELEQQGVSATTIAPGGHRTQFLDSIVWAKNAHDPSSQYRGLTTAFTNMMKTLAARPSAPGSDAVAKAVLKLVQKSVGSKKLPRQVVVGKDAWLVVVFKSLLPTGLYQGLMKSSFKVMLKSRAC